MGDWTQKLRTARPEGATAVDETAEDEDQGHMSAADLGKLRMGAGAGVDDGTERWVSGVSISDQRGDRAKLTITIDLGPSGIPPAIEAQLKIAGGERIPGTRFRVTVAGGSCVATLDVDEHAARILQAHALGELVAVFERWPAPADRPSRTPEAPRR